MKREQKKKSKMRNVLGVLFLVAGFGTSLYVGLWLLFIKPIIAACIAFDAGTLTAVLIGCTIIKCLCASTVLGLGVMITSVIAPFIFGD